MDWIPPTRDLWESAERPSEIAIIWDRRSIMTTAGRIKQALITSLACQRSMNGGHSLSISEANINILPRRRDIPMHSPDSYPTLISFLMDHPMNLRRQFPQGLLPHKIPFA